MATVIILVVIYISYIGLGIPDSLTGAAWPVTHLAIGADISSLSYISCIISIGTIISSFMSERIVKKFHTVTVAILSTALTVIALFGYSQSKNLLWFCLLAIPQGLGAGSIDAALNNYVALHYNATQMSFLHCFYGVGVAASPYIISTFLKDNTNWRRGYTTMAVIQLVICVIITISLPLWKKADADKYSEDASKKEIIKFKSLMKNGAVRAQWLVFIGDGFVEALCNVWGGTYLVVAKGLSPEYGAKIVTLYFIGLALGRFLSGFAVKKLSCIKVVYCSLSILLVAVVLFFMSQSTVSAMAALFFTGLGIGPVFPNMTQITPDYFGKDASQAIIGSQMGFSYIAILLSPVIFSVVSKKFGIGIFPMFLALFFVLTFISTVLLSRRIAKENNIIIQK